MLLSSVRHKLTASRERERPGEAASTAPQEFQLVLHFLSLSGEVGCADGSKVVP